MTEMAKDIKDYFNKDIFAQSTSRQATIETVRREVTKIQGPSLGIKKRNQYSKLTAKEKAKIASYATKNGVTAALKHFKHTGEFTELRESMVRGWKETYRKQLTDRTGKRSAEPIEELPTKRRGRPLLLGEDIEEEVRGFLKAIRHSGGPVNTQVAIATAKGVVTAYDATLLTENGGHIDLTKDWAKCLLGRMGLVKWHVTTKAKVTLVDYEEKKDNILLTFGLWYTWEIYQVI